MCTTTLFHASVIINVIRRRQRGLEGCKTSCFTTFPQDQRRKQTAHQKSCTLQEQTETESREDKRGGKGLDHTNEIPEIVSQQLYLSV